MRQHPDKWVKAIRDLQAYAKSIDAKLSNVVTSMYLYRIETSVQKSAGVASGILVVAASLEDAKLFAPAAGQVIHCICPADSNALPGIYSLKKVATGVDRRGFPLVDGEMVIRSSAEEKAIPIRELGVARLHSSFRQTADILAMQGIHTIDAVLLCTVEALLAMSGMGVTRVNKLIVELAKHNLALAV
jgi:hypothetical protein